MVRTAIQLQSVRDLDCSVPEIIERVGQTDLDGVELYDLDIEDPIAVRDALEATSLEPVGVHVYLDRLDREYESVLETYDRIGCRRIVIPRYDPGAFETRDGTVEAARRLSELGSSLAADGFQLLYHNHDEEFTSMPDGTAFDILVEALDGNVRVEFDTGLALYGGSDPVGVLRKHGDRTEALHLTDSVPGSEATIQVELGGGELDVRGCVSAARRASVPWLIYEHGMTADPLGSLEHAAMVLPHLVDGHVSPDRSSQATD